MDPTVLYEGVTCGAQHSGALAALRLLRSYNHFVVPPDGRSMLPLLSALPPPCLPPYCQHLPGCTPMPLPIDSEGRRRGEKRPIPAELKDEKYFERRRRNNQAAKKSRDARRMREDQIAWRACLLEQENASLRAHINVLRQEVMALRALLATRDEAAVPTSTTTD
ncbi:nuclear factor interleukin-3-regulated protein-like [Aricia agestis]|uniref:nuclear factor interleukin-3-regulated protein-like n=1 Tax=Aricia agestis TaxID=91739 RepID=UPI001C20487D|nr:nuclear factor interleukin-3-regulated protein-like [Aricia agestis]